MYSANGSLGKSFMTLLLLDGMQFCHSPDASFFSPDDFSEVDRPKRLLSIPQGEQKIQEEV